MTMRWPATRRRRARAFLSAFASVFALLALLSGCSTSTGNDDNEIDAVTITPPTPVLSVGAVQQLVANPTTAGGRIVPAVIIWESDAPLVASVDEDGLVTALSSGTANISATAGGKTATAAITVTAFAIATP